MELSEIDWFLTQRNEIVFSVPIWPLWIPLRILKYYLLQSAPYKIISLESSMLNQFLFSLFKIVCDSVYWIMFLPSNGDRENDFSFAVFQTDFIFGKYYKLNLYYSVGCCFKKENYARHARSIRFLIVNAAFNRYIIYFSSILLPGEFHKKTFAYACRLNSHQIRF